MQRGIRVTILHSIGLLLLLGAIAAVIVFLPDALSRVSAAPQQQAIHQHIPGTRGTATKFEVVNVADVVRREALARFPPRGPKEVPEFMPVPNDMPVPDDVTSTRIAAPAAASFPPLIPSPQPSTSFQALDDSLTVIPPDTMGAVGPNHVMTTLNDRIRFHSRTGTIISTITLDSFWASVGNPDVFDPKLLYDPFNNRWILTAVANAQSATSAVLMGVSQTSNPTGTWNLYSIDTDPADLAWADYPSTGFNQKWIIVSVNMFNISNNAFNRAHSYVFDKANLYAGGTSGNHTLFNYGNSLGATHVPAITYDNALQDLYLVNNWNGNSAGQGFLRRFTVSGSVGSETLTAGPFPTSPDPWDSSHPIIGGTSGGFVPQNPAPAVSANRIMNNDARIQNVVYRNGSIWCVHTVFLPAGGSPVRSAVQWWQFLPGTGTGSIVPLQRARIEDPSANVTNVPSGKLFAFPSIAVNQFEDVLIGYSRFGSDQYAGANYSFRSGADPLNTMREDTVLKDGEGRYNKGAGSGASLRVRWGDYGNSVVDPVNDTDFWTIQEYADSRINNDSTSRWATWWGHITLSLCTYSISPSSASFGSQEGIGAVQVATQSGCTWNAVSDSEWISITSGTTGNGNGKVQYSVAKNQSVISRTGNLTIAGQTFIVTQFQYPAVKAAITSPPPGSTFSSSTVTLNWNAGTLIPQYWLWVGTYLTGVDIFNKDQGNGLSANVSGLPTNGNTIYVRLWSLLNGRWEYNDYTYTAVTSGPNVPAQITSPAPGSTLASSSQQFSWNSGTGVSRYWMEVGSTSGGNDLYSADQGTTTSVTVGGLPTDGRSLYARLWSLIQSSWQFNDYTYAAASTASGRAQIYSPAPGSVLSSSTVTFMWTIGTGVSQYWLYIGSAVGRSDIYSANQGTNLSVTVNGLPTDGRTLYIRLWSLIGATWELNDYTYTAATVAGSEKGGSR